MDRNCYKFLLRNGDYIMETVDCPYCGETFEGESEGDARTKEGVHRAENHVNNNSESTKKASKGRSIVDDWKSEGKRV